MRSEGDGLKALYGAALMSERTGRGGEHLDDETFERLALHELGGAEREAVLSHLVCCPTCADVFRGLSELAREAAKFDPGAPRVSQPKTLPRRRWALPIGIAVAAAAAAGLLLVPRLLTYSHPPPAGEQQLRAGSPVRSVIVEGPTGLLRVAPAGFAWRPFPDATGYRVRLFSEDGSLLWASGSVATARVAWPAGLALAPGRYFWQVEARREGARIAVSALVAIEHR
jgi:hypothetical protein